MCSLVGYDPVYPLPLKSLVTGNMRELKLI